MSSEDLNKNLLYRDFLGGSVVKTLRFHCRGYGFHPWSGELRSQMLRGTAKKKKIPPAPRTKNLLYQTP